MIFTADPKAGYLAHREALDQAVREVMESGTYILGRRVSAFEEHFATYLGAAHCVAVNSGTDALSFALRSFGIGPGDRVITVSFTAVATVAAIDWIGAKPVLVDIDPQTFTMDPEKLDDTIKRQAKGHVKAILPVHLYGHPADMVAVEAVSRRYGVPILEDCAQAHGAAVGARKVGSIGLSGAFSFYPTKNLGAFGDGGAVTTSDAAIAERVRLLRQYGWRERYVSDEPGYNSRLDELQAAILDCKLAWLDESNERRRQIAARYDQGLKGLPLELPAERPGVRHVYHQYVVRSPEREDLRSHLESRGVGTSVLYPVPIHLQQGYRQRVSIGEGGLAISERSAKEILCLPVYPELSDAQVDHVIDATRSYFLS